MSKKPGFHNFTGYVPNYKQLNITPNQMSPSNGAQFVVSTGSKQNPRERAVPRTRAIPFAEVVIEDKFPIGTGPVPNIGNNIEHTWAGVDGEIVDDIGLYDGTHQEMIDNNDFVEIDEPTPGHQKIEEEIRKQETYEYQAPTDEGMESFVDTKKLEDYTLLIFGEFYSSGSLEEIQREVADILYEQHPLCKHAKITLDDITVLKKVAIKFGVFISEE